jgi:hypothetical protein
MEQYILKKKYGSNVHEEEGVNGDCLKVAKIHR